MVNLKQRSFLTLKDYSQEEIRYLLDLAHKLKKSKKEGRIGKTFFIPGFYGARCQCGSICTNMV